MNMLRDVDDNKKPVKAGEYGSKILVSVLFSRTQPLICYEISDNVRFSGVEVPCSMVYRRINGVRGR